QIGVSRYRARLVFRHQQILTRRLLSRYLYKPWTFFLDNNSNVLAHNVQSNLNYIIGCFYLPLVQIASDVIIIVVLFTFLTLLSAGVSLVLA
ncbi:hypothetical protein ACKI16_46735, partial [Streptomyces scabiei]